MPNSPPRAPDSRGPQNCIILPIVSPWEWRIRVEIDRVRSGIVKPDPDSTLKKTVLDFSLSILKSYKKIHYLIKALVNEYLRKKGFFYRDFDIRIRYCGRILIFFFSVRI